VQTYPLEFIELPKKNYCTNCVVNPIPVAVRFKAWFCGRSLAGIAGLNLTMGGDVRLLLVLFVVRVLCVGLLARPEESYGAWCA